MFQLKATVYTPPHGEKEIITVENVFPEDRDWFIRNQIELSMETLSTDQHVVYGHYDQDDNEIIQFDKGGCALTLQALRKQIEPRLTSYVLLYQKDGQAHYHEFQACHNKQAMDMVFNLIEQLTPTESWKLLRTQPVQQYNNPPLSSVEPAGLVGLPKEQA